MHIQQKRSSLIHNSAPKKKRAVTLKSESKESISNPHLSTEFFYFLILRYAYPMQASIAYFQTKIIHISYAKTNLEASADKPLTAEI